MLRRGYQLHHVMLVAATKRSADRVRMVASGRMKTECVGWGEWRGEKQKSGRDPATGFHPSVECRATLKLGACRDGTGPAPWNAWVSAQPRCPTQSSSCIVPSRSAPALRHGQPNTPLLCLVWLPNPSLSHHLLCQCLQPLPPICHDFWSTSAVK